MLNKLKLHKKDKSRSYTCTYNPQGGSGRMGRVGYPQKCFNPLLPVLKAGLSGPPQHCTFPKPN